MSSESRFPDCALWDFAVAVYRRPGAASACLALQARRRVDVNLLLYCLWVGVSGRGRLAPDALRHALAEVGPWHEKIVRGLRGARDQLKEHALQAPADLAQRLRKEILAVELDAEHIEELILAQLAPPTIEGVAGDARAAHAAYNMSAYLLMLGGAADERDRADLRTLLTVAFPDVGPDLLDRALDGATR